MSFPESDISDILEKADAEELFKNVHEMVQYVDDSSSYGQENNENLQGAFRQFDVEQTVDLKQELLFRDFQMDPQQLIPEVPAVFRVLQKVCNEEYAGPYNFEVSIIPNGSKNPWVYSPSLNKVFIDMNAHFPVEFRLATRPSDQLYVRVMPCFSSLQYSQELVYRCVQHEQPQLNKNIPDHVRQHIIQCAGNANVQYLGDRYSNQRLSLVFPLGYPQTGSEAVREMFVFVCKNSCPTGMNRKPIEIIFSLENSNGDTLGRRSLNVRICSCPKRDLEKEEKDSSTKTAPQGKKRKLEGKVLKPTTTEVKDKNIHTITLELAGKHNVQQVLKICQDMMAGEIVRNPHSNDAFVSCYRKLTAQINQLQ